MKKRSSVTSILFAAGILVIGACSPSAHIEKDKHADFSRYKTYSWMGGDQGKNNNTRSLTTENIQSLVNEELKKEDWREVRNNPDILIGYDVLVERTTQQKSKPVYSQPYSRLYFNPYTRRYGTLYYPSQLMGYEKEPYSAKEGTITVTMIDVRSDKMVWQGWSTSEVNSNNLTQKEIQMGVRSIFRKFDIAKN